MELIFAALNVSSTMDPNVVIKQRFLHLFSSSACHSALANQISSKSNDPQRSYDVISFFSRWQPADILDLIWIILGHKRSAIVGLRFVLNWSRSDLQFRIYCDFYIFPFLVETAYSRPLVGVVVAYFPQSTSLCGNTSFEPQSVKIGLAVRPRRFPERKTRNSSDDETSNVNFSRRHRHVLRNTKKEKKN